MSGAMSAPDPNEVRPSLWRHADFMKLWTAETVSQLGTQVTLLALPLTAILILKASHPGETGPTLSGKPRGSIGVLIFWLLVFFPAAIVYAIIRDWSGSRAKLEK